MFVIGMDSKVGEKYLGLGDGDEHTWNGMEWNGANSDLATAATTEKKGETETRSERNSEFGTEITANLWPDNERA